jgi:hypothetical protein
MEDLIRVVVDQGTMPKKNKKNCDTGLFKCIYKGGKLKL